MPRILGIDPGSVVTGFGVVEFSGSHAAYLDSGTIRTGRKDLASRLKIIFEDVSEVVNRYRPDALAIEEVFVHQNVATALKLGQARGAAILAAAVQGIAVFEYTPTQIKKSVTGRGHASKEQVQHMVKILLCLAHKPPSDAADALAVSLCHGHRNATLSRIEENTARAARARR